MRIQPNVSSQFDSKTMDKWESDSDDVDESLTVPGPPVDDNDPIIEYEDEFGRARTGRKSEEPRHLLKDEQEEEEDIEYVASLHLRVIIPDSLSL